MNWRVISASAVGSSHEKAGVPCQDFCSCRLLIGSTDGTVLLIVASDGAGSSPKGADGAKLACELWCAEVESLLDSGGTLRQISRDFVVQWIDRFLQEVAWRASDGGLRARDYACTFLTALVSDDVSVFAQVGDGAIVIEDLENEDEYCWVFWPQKGEYENQTRFLTDADAMSSLEHCCERPVNEVIILTDGLERVALHFPTRSAFSPFFRSVLGPVRSNEGVGFLDELSEGLRLLLRSDYINRRTDDDKTLMIATRKPVSGIVGDDLS